MILGSFARAAQQEQCPEGSMGPDPTVSLLPETTPTPRVSLTSLGGEIFVAPGKKNSSYPSCSDDAVQIAFITTAEHTPASGGVTPDNPDKWKQMWHRDLSTGVSRLVSGGTWNATGRSEPGNMASERGSVNGNGKFAVFQSLASNFDVYAGGSFIPDDTPAFGDVWMYDMMSFELTRLSSEPATGHGGNGLSYGPPEATAFGRYVTFVTRATNLTNVNTKAGNCSLQPRGGKDNIVLLDRGYSNLAVDPQLNLSSRTICWVSHGVIPQYILPNGPLVVGDCIQPNGESEQPSISASGCKIAYRSRATNLSLTDQFAQAPTPIWHIYVYDRTTGLNELISKSTGGAIANGHSDWPEISADGRYVIFSSQAFNLDNADPNGSVPDIFVRDLQAGTTRLVTYGQDGFPFQGGGYGGSRNPEISPSGRFLTYACTVGDPAMGQNPPPRPYATVLLYDLDADQNGVLTTLFGSSEFEVQHLSVAPGPVIPDDQTVGPLMFSGMGKYIFFRQRRDEPPHVAGDGHEWSRPQGTGHLPA